ncbi:sulfatase [Vallitaleaceae bacterium 9-2]
MKKYNVLYVHTHDSGRYFSPYGYKLDTPNLEKFSKNAHVFNQAFSVSPTCSPSRSALLSSQYPHQNGMIGLVNRGFKMQDYQHHLVNTFNQAQYDTVLCGIQHEAGHYKEADKAADIIGYCENITTTLNLDDLIDKRPWDIDNVSNAIAWLKKHNNKSPFFMSMGFFGTHRPYPPMSLEGLKVNHGVPEGMANVMPIRHDFSQYNTSVECVDTLFGQILDTLEEEKLLEDTIIVFTTDHGIAVPHGKSNLTDLGLEVALMFYLPWSTQGRSYEGLVSHLDVMPTLCDYLKLKPEHKMEGKSLVPMLEKREEHVHDALFFEMNFHTSFEPARAIRTQRYKYIEYLDDYALYQLSNINDSPTKDFLVESGLKQKEKPLYQLYDLYHDPHEKNNLVDNLKYNEILEELRRQLNQWRKATQDILYEEGVELKPEWVINKKESTTPNGSSKDDFLEGHIHKKWM